MKYPRFFLSLFLLLALTACESNSPITAIDYNNKIVDIQYAVLGSFDLFIEAVDASDSLAAADALEAALDTARVSSKKLSTLEDFDGSGELRNDAKALIDFYVESLDDEYRKIYPVLVDKNATLQELVTADSIKDVFVVEEDALYEKLVATQTAFAVKYKFDLTDE